MVKLSNVKLSHRVIFKSGKQYQFLLNSIKLAKLTWPILAKRIGVHPRTLNDWKRERYSLPLEAMKQICISTKVDEPQQIMIKPRYWQNKENAKAGGIAVYRKYGSIGGDQKKRKQKWLEWWQKKGRFNPNKYFVVRNIYYPKKNSELAEFVGIMLGDGSINKKQITVTLNYKTDKQYINFVSYIINKLFHTKVNFYTREKYSVTNVVVSRVKLVSFCQSIGLKIGNKLKHNLDIPSWIKGDRALEIACVRGLIDTDGCIFNECHNTKNKRYCYSRISFVSASKTLRLSVYKILKKLGFSPKIRNNRNTQIELIDNIIKYFKIIGTHNQKHELRFKSFVGGVG